MGLVKVERPLGRPNHCAVFPQLGSAHPKKYWDTGNELPGLDPRIYISVEAIEHLARLEGFVSREDHAISEARLEAAMGKIQTLERLVEEKQRALDAVELLKAEGFVEAVAA